MNTPLTHEEVKAGKNLIPQFPNRRARRAIKQNRSGGNRKHTKARIKHPQ